MVERGWNRKRVFFRTLNALYNYVSSKKKNHILKEKLRTRITSGHQKHLEEPKIIKCMGKKVVFYRKSIRREIKKCIFRYLDSPHWYSLSAPRICFQSSCQRRWLEPFRDNLWHLHHHQLIRILKMRTRGRSESNVRWSITNQES